FTEELAADVVARQDASCGEENGSFGIRVSNGTAPFTYDWNDNTLDGTQNPTGLTVGTYTVIITDDSGCTGNQTITLTEPPLLVLDNCEATTSATGMTNADGIATIFVSGGGGGPYTISYTGPQNGTTTGAGPGVVINGLLPGDYTVTSVMDVNNCTAALNCNFTILTDEPCDLILDCGEVAPATGAGTADGIGTVVFGGGTPGYIITLEGPVNDTRVEPLAGLIEFNNLLAGTYDVILEDAGGCRDTCELIINGPAPCILSTSQSTQSDVSCNGGSDGTYGLVITSTNPPDIVYSWPNPNYQGDSLFVDLEAGTYSLTITDGPPSCQAIIGFTIAEPDTILVDCAAINPTSAPLATDGSGSVTYSGGTAPYQIILEGGATPDTLNGIANAGTTAFNNLGVGAYTVRVIDANGCEVSCSFPITSQGCPLLVTPIVQQISCNGEADGRIVLDIIDFAPGALTVDWDQDAFDGQQDVGPLGPGTYTVTVTDASGCLFPVPPITIVDPPVLSIECAVISDVSAPNAMDGAAEGIITGGTGPYQLITRRIVGNLSVNDTMTISVADTVQVSNLSGGDPPAPYEFVVVDANGCRDTCSFVIFEMPCPNIFITQEDLVPVACQGESTGRIEVSVANATEPIQYTWTPVQPDTNALDNLPAGTYTLVVTDANMCTAAQAFEVVEPTSTPGLSCQAVSDETQAGAQDGVAELTTTGDAIPFSITIAGTIDSSFILGSVGTTQLPNLAPGIYEVFLTDANGCGTDTCSFTIASGTCQLAVVGSVVAEDCLGPGQASLAITGGIAPVTIDWSVDSIDGMSDVSLLAGTYSVTVTDAGFCADTLEITIPLIDNAPAIAVADSGAV
ncbi:MAG: hypothetical protein AAFU03_07995, partial [Bacteroidota bacterium]